MHKENVFGNHQNIVGMMYLNMNKHTTKRSISFRTEVHRSRKEFIFIVLHECGIFDTITQRQNLQ